MSSPSVDLYALREFYSGELLENVIPWWMQHGFDPQNGAVCETITEAGEIRSYDKAGWSQGRALFIWSRLYNVIGQRHEWLEVAERLFEFWYSVGKRENWRWPAKVDREGNTLQGDTDVYTDGFAIMGLTEYARATGDERAVQAALDTFEIANERIQAGGEEIFRPDTLPPGSRLHGISMIFATVFHELGKLVDDAQILKAGHSHALQILDDYLKPEYKLLLEHVALDGSELNDPIGRQCIPGHAIESMWFLMRLFSDRGEPAQVARCIEGLRWHVEAGWDWKYGGIVAALTAGHPPVTERDAKIMWPQTEAMYALLLAYSLSGERWCLEWYDRVHEWVLSHYPVAEHGEWHRTLNRDGSFPGEGSGDNVRKEPFHLARLLIFATDLLTEMTTRATIKTCAIDTERIHNNDY